MQRVGQLLKKGLKLKTNLVANGQYGIGRLKTCCRIGTDRGLNKHVARCLFLFQILGIAKVGYLQHYVQHGTQFIGWGQTREEVNANHIVGSHLNHVPNREIAHNAAIHKLSAVVFCCRENSWDGHAASGGKSQIAAIEHHGVARTNVGCNALKWYVQLAKILFAAHGKENLAKACLHLIRLKDTCGQLGFDALHWQTEYVVFKLIAVLDANILETWLTAY